jgi:hypothetical protein
MKIDILHEKCHAETTERVYYISLEFLNFIIPRSLLRCEAPGSSQNVEKANLVVLNAGKALTARGKFTF